MLLSVVMPAYNEKPTIAEIIRRVKAADMPKELIVVDDGSTDGTREYLRGLIESGEAVDGASGADGPVRVFFHERNRGKGAALRTGFAQARGDVVLIQDADLEYNPQEYPVLLQPILDGRADVVYGTRFRGGGAQRILFYWHSVGNKFLTGLTNMITNLTFTDMETCYKVFRREVIQGIQIKCDGFGFEPEITAKIAKRRLHIYEVPISYSGREYAEGKKITWLDGLKAIFIVIWFRFFE